MNLEFMREIQAEDMHLAAYRWNLKQEAGEINSGMSIDVKEKQFRD